MLFIAICRDRPGHVELRLANREAHLAWITTVASAVRIAGPWLDDAGETMVGSMLVAEAEDLAAAKALFANDPYAKAGLFDSVEIHPWRWVIGAPAEQQS